jgi:single-strand DNA-binding protein
MASDRNKCEFIGRLGKDPETLVSQSGIKVTKFSICVNEKRKDTETSMWLDIVAFDKLAELVAQYCSKGMKVLVDGRLQKRTFERKDGSKGLAVEILADGVTFLEKKSESGPVPGGSSTPAPSQPSEEDDLPF